MKKLLILVGAGLAILLLLAVVGVFLLRWAAAQEPDFYVEALDTPPAEQEQASEEMLQRATDLRSAVEKPGRWEAVFSDDQINGWLSVDLVRNHPDALPRGISDPRVAITADAFQAACRFQEGSIQGVVSLTCDISVPQPNLVAIRIRRVAVGLVPLPMHRVIDAVTQAAGKNNVLLTWERVEGDPVAMITIPPPQDADEKRVTLDTIQLADGEIYLSGETQ